MGFLDKFKKKKQPMYLYTEKELAQYEQFIADQFGDYDQVFHEIVSPDIHLDVIMVPPTEEQPYYKLITMGMGAYKMNVPKELKEQQLEYAELVIYLPPDWNLQSSDEKDYWPIRQLKNTARIPIWCDTWLGWGHTLSADENNSAYAENTELCSLVLFNGLNYNYEPLKLSLGGKKINFYQLFPLYREELELKQQIGAEELMDRFDADDLFPIVNIERKNYGLE